MVTGFDVAGSAEERLSQGTRVRTALSLLGEAQAAREAAIAELLDERRAIDAKLTELGAGAEKPKKKVTNRVCRGCGEPGHNARSCPRKNTKETAA